MYYSIFWPHLQIVSHNPKLGASHMWLAPNSHHYTTTLWYTVSDNLLFLARSKRSALSTSVTIFSFPRALVRSEQEIKGDILCGERTESSPTTWHFRVRGSASRLQLVTWVTKRSLYTEPTPSLVCKTSNMPSAIDICMLTRSSHELECNGKKNSGSL